MLYPDTAPPSSFAGAVQLNPTAVLLVAVTVNPVGAPMFTAVISSVADDAPAPTELLALRA